MIFKNCFSHNDASTNKINYTQRFLKVHLNGTMVIKPEKLYSGTILKSMFSKLYVKIQDWVTE